MSGLAALTLALEGGTPAGSNLGIRALATGPGRVAMRAAATGEVIADKLLPLPARTRPLPLIGRLLLGAAAGWGLARLARSDARLSAMTGAAAAVAAAIAATRLRAHATAHGTPDHVVGLGEDLCVALLTRFALRTL
jgi:hypothetical protein